MHGTSITLWQMVRGIRCGTQMRAGCLCSRIYGGIDLRLDVGSQHADVIKGHDDFTCNGVVLGGEKRFG